MRCFHGFHCIFNVLLTLVVWRVNLFDFSYSMFGLQDFVKRMSSGRLPNDVKGAHEGIDRTPNILNIRYMKR